MSDLVKRARGLAEKATPGPWRTGTRVLRTIYDGSDRLIGTMDLPEDAAFVAAARAIVPELCDRVEALERDVEEAEANAASLKRDLDAEEIRHIEEWAAATARASRADGAAGVIAEENTRLRGALANREQRDDGEIDAAYCEWGEIAVLLGRKTGESVRGDVERLMRERDALLANLTATQSRCTALFEETQAARNERTVMHRRAQHAEGALARLSGAREGAGREVARAHAERRRVASMYRKRLRDMFDLLVFFGARDAYLREDGTSQRHRYECFAVADLAHQRDAALACLREARAVLGSGPLMNRIDALLGTEKT